MIIRRKHTVIFALAAFFCLVPATTYAQQITSGTVPDTQNPQQTQTDVIENDNQLQQSTNVFSVDGGNSAIGIPDGQPVSALQQKENKENKDGFTIVWLLAPTLLILTYLVLWTLRRNNQPVFKNSEPAASPVVESSVKESPQPTPKKAKATKNTTASNTKKKKRRAQTKKKTTKKK